METPPLARRKLIRVVVRLCRKGNTSACAEKTDYRTFVLSMNEKHLRLRGENRLLLTRSSIKLETPPLARRKLVLTFDDTAKKGNTSACAEKTRREPLSYTHKRKHLRLRGENSLKAMQRSSAPETPPLARRKHKNHYNTSYLFGNTSACAEKTTARAF